jgi:hypothetical protein
MGIKSGKVDVVNSIPTYNATVLDWIEWHKGLKSNFGKKMANSLFLKAWKIRGSSKLNTGDLRTYLNSQGIKMDTNAWDKLVDFGGDVSDSIGGTFQAGKIVSITLGVILLGGLGLLVFNIARKPNETIRLATTLGSRGLIK